MFDASHTPDAPKAADGREAQDLDAWSRHLAPVQMVVILRGYPSRAV